MTNTLQRFRLMALDKFQYGATSQHVISKGLELADSIVGQGSSADDVARSLQRLTLAARLGTGRRDISRVESKIANKSARWQARELDWNRFFPGSQRRLVQKSIILKAPQPGGEKGVLFVAWEDNWLRLLRYADLQRSAKDYHLVLSPTWSPPHDLPMLTAAKLWPSVVFTIMSNLDDEAAFRRLSSNIEPIPLLASSWVNPEVFRPTENVRTGPMEYDVVMLASFAGYKRHIALFRALQKMRKDVRVALVGKRMGDRTSETVEQEARLFGVRDRIEMKVGIPDDEMIRTMHSSKVSLITSLREGSCVAVAESLVADVPVGLIEDANVGSRAFINEHTGRFLRADHMAEDLEDFIAHYRDYQPRHWMLEHGKTCYESSRILNDSIKQWALNAGEPWTTDLVPMHWRPNPQYLCADDATRLPKPYVRFESDYGISVECPTSVPSTAMASTSNQPKEV